MPVKCIPSNCCTPCTRIEGELNYDPVCLNLDIKQTNVTISNPAIIYLKINLISLYQTAMV